jgi:hypothetical protein
MTLSLGLLPPFLSWRMVSVKINHVWDGFTKARAGQPSARL